MRPGCNARPHFVAGPWGYVDRLVWGIGPTYQNYLPIAFESIIFAKKYLRWDRRGAARFEAPVIMPNK